MYTYRSDLWYISANCHVYRYADRCGLWCIPYTPFVWWWLYTKNPYLWTVCTVCTLNHNGMHIGIYVDMALCAINAHWLYTQWLGTYYSECVRHMYVWSGLCNTMPHSHTCSGSGVCEIMYHAKGLTVELSRPHPQHVNFESVVCQVRGRLK